jgi:hypothetical protein
MKMNPAPVIAGLLVASPALAAAASAPTPAQLSEALGGTNGPHVTNLRCESSSPGYVRCTYLEWRAQGYTRWAVLVSPHAGRWTISEGPIRERPRQVFRR